MFNFVTVDGSTDGSITFKPPSWFIHKPRALFYTLINGICLTTSFVATQSSIDQKKSWTWHDSCDSQNRKRLILNSRTKRLHTPGEITSDSGRIDSGSGRKRLRANRTSGETTCFQKTMPTITPVTQSSVVKQYSRTSIYTFYVSVKKF